MWPADLNRVHSNMNTTELWVLKERMASTSRDNCWAIVQSDGFAEFSKFTIEFKDTGERFEIEEFSEVIDAVTRL